jgi:hypothetical protein
MPRLKPDVWDKVRIKRETEGTSYPKLGQEFGVSHTAVLKRAKMQHWKQAQHAQHQIQTPVQTGKTGAL